jgi:hypothetical protein
MHVINGAADLQHVRVNLAEYPGKIVMKPFADVR